jgi:hypothetical protein
MWHIMTGGPAESKETLRETFDTILQVAYKWDLVVVMNAIRAYKGAHISKLMQKENPNCTNDNFLTPLFYSPPNINPEAMRIFNKRIAFKHPHVLFPDEVQRVPLILLKISTAIMRFLAPQKPWWQFNIFVNKMLKALGINALKRRMFEYKHRKIAA